MVESVVLLVLAVMLALYALWELAPAAWESGLGRLRSSGGGGATVALPVGVMGGRTVAPSAAVPREMVRSRLLTLWLPLAIVALAFALRVVQLTGVPYGFFCDEASATLDAYFILHTLHDQHGAFLPAYFQSLGQWDGGLHTYWNVPFVALFGLTELASRMSTAVAGTLTIWLTYFFVKKATKSTEIGLITAFLLATSPWHIMQSRNGWQVINLPLIIALILTFLYLGLERPRWLPLVFICSALSFYGYHPLSVFVPLFSVALIAMYAAVLLREWRRVIIGCLIGLVVLIPTFLAIVNGTAFARFNQLNTAPMSLGQHIGTFISNYLASFSLDFLFNTSSTDWITRHSVRGFGLLYPIELPFILIGIAVLLWRHNRFDLLCLIWLLAYPIAGALVGPPILTHAIVGLIVFQIIAAQGLYASAVALGRLGTLRPYRQVLMPTLAVVLLLVGIGATGQFMNFYLNGYPLYSSGWDGWQSGAKGIVSYFVSHHNSYDQELMDAEFNAPDELLRFYETPYAWPCPTCTITNVADPAAVRGQQVASQRQLWAVSPSVLQASALNSVPHRIVGHLTYPNGQISWVFVATGPGIA